MKICSVLAPSTSATTPTRLSDKVEIKKYKHIQRKVLLDKSEGEMTEL